MPKIFAIAEHRQGQVRDVTYEILTKGRELAEKTGAELIAVIMGKEVKEHAKTDSVSGAGLGDLLHGRPSPRGDAPLMF